jgi:hypothetical protein
VRAWRYDERLRAYARFFILSNVAVKHASLTPSLSRREKMSRKSVYGLALIPTFLPDGDGFSSLSPWERN